MKYALVNGVTLVKFPYSLLEFRKDNANVSFPPNFSVPMRGKTGDIVEVTKEAKPSVTDSQVTELNPTPSLKGDKWVLGWTVRNKSASEKERERNRLSSSLVGFVTSLHKAGHITEQEAVDWVSGNTLPTVVETVLTKVPQSDRLSEKLNALSSVDIERMGALSALLRVELGLTHDEMDSLFK